MTPNEQHLAAAREPSPRWLLDWVQYVDHRGAVAFIVLQPGREDQWPLWRHVRRALTPDET